VEPMQRCDCCGKEKPKRIVHRNSITKKLICTACAEKEYRAKRPEVCRLAEKKWRSRNPRKYKKLVGEAKARARELHRLWRLQHTKERRKERRRYYHSVFSNPINTRNTRQQWTLKDQNLITAPDRPNDRTLSAKIGRSISAIQVQRNILKKQATFT